MVRAPRVASDQEAQVKGSVSTVGGTVIVLVSVGHGNVSYPSSALVKVPSGSGTIYLGGSAVTAATGFPLAAGEGLEVDMVNEALYAIATVTTTVNILRRGD